MPLAATGPLPDRRADVHMERNPPTMGAGRVVTAGLAVKQAVRWTAAAVGAVTIAGLAGCVLMIAGAAWWVDYQRRMER